MRPFKFKDWIFNNLLPYFYQNHDTYQDDSGKGILQRFMEVCSGYFDTDILEDQDNQPGLDNILDIIDPDKTPELFLNYLWEFLGEIPYAYGLIIQNEPYNKDNLRDWVFHNSDFPKSDPRKLLKYAISLYKIRGTEEFYDILGTFYGFGLELIETSEGGEPGSDLIIPNHDHLVLATYEDSTSEDGLTIATYALGDKEVRAPYPDGDCYSCLYFLLKVNVDKSQYDDWVSNSRIPIVKNIIQGIVDKYLPIHCKVAQYEDGSYKIIMNVINNN